MLRSASGASYEVHSSFRKMSKLGHKRIEAICPLCGERGHRVLKVTVTNHVDSSYWSMLKDKWYWFCSNPSCKMVYYNNESEIYFMKDEVKTRVYHKESDPSRPVCYCLAVTENDIRNEIFVKRCCDSLEDIQEYTKAGTGRWCPVTNPSGKCCKEYLTELVDSLLKKRAPREVEGGLGDVQESLRLSIPKARTTRENRATLLIKGMTCDGCSIAVRGALENLGLKVIRVSWKDGLAEVEDLGDINENIVREIIEDIGYKLIKIVK